MQLNDLLSNPPKLHVDTGGHIATHQVSDEVLRFVDVNIDENSSTLETGAGLSTILFAMKRTSHICIVPDADQIARIRGFCEQNGISTRAITFVPDKSETVLPSLKDVELDLIMIDGRHGFPAPFIDWYYTATKLKKGGLLVVDDTQLWTGDALKKFLVMEREWRLERDFPRSAIFRKTAAYDPSREWTDQPYVVRKSKFLQSGARLRSGLSLLRARNFGEVARKLRAALMRTK